jgi:2-dehydro-3-deoxyphosphogluconate aldolase/(4S)-4-hydroxy-2-oxoglutarate aldolase
MKIETLLEHKVVAVVRHATPDNIVFAASALLEGGISAIEITIENHGGIQAIETLANSGLDICLGAGTVLDGLMGTLAIQAGAKFLVSPILNEKMIKVAHKHNVLAIPGVLTPNEIMAAINAQADMIKIFPVGSMGISYLKSIQAPLPKIPMMVTGGVTLENAHEYLEVADAVGLGSQLIDLRKPFNEIYRKEIVENAKKLMSSIK